LIDNFQLAFDKGINLEPPKSCPICGEDSVQEVTRRQFVRFTDEVPKSSAVIAYRCDRGHVFLPARLMEEGAVGGHEDTRHSNDAEIRRLQERQKRLNDALRLLFDLLEDYSPLWYTKEHHDQAADALELDENSLL